MKLSDFSPKPPEIEHLYKNPKFVTDFLFEAGLNSLSDVSFYNQNTCFRGYTFRMSALR